MKHDHFVVQSPDKPAQQLLLLFHGVGDNPVAMGEIGSWFAPLFPDALVVSVGGAEPSGNPAGRQWFSVQGITEDNRQARVDAIMPTFIETVRYWQKQSGVGANATALIGFSQGAIMALESIKAEPGLASRVIAFNGRYASLPETVEDLGHAIDNRSMQFALDHLRYTIPKHYFDEALSGGKPGDDDVIEMM
ncbi:esterase [Escherichia coli]|uniref:esterase n=1 Tax=Escherichia coli TaxID=562 RepID=UPI00028DA088|nr:esterase [Escherichia coli]EFK3483753.1 esterase [Escherichia coli]EKH91263.1 hypothetical protein EC5905_3826 [Escherichia coli 5905]PIS75748.1 hydrolase [Escherichia coli O55:H7 str. USDA 5905]QKQ90083.1 esterase [Escherichia coli O55:H7]